jgi:hypothetical protein
VNGSERLATARPAISYRAFREKTQTMTKPPHCQTKVWRHAAMFPPRLDKSRGNALPLFFAEERLHPSHAVLSSYRNFRAFHHVHTDRTLIVRPHPCS